MSVLCGIDEAGRGCCAGDLVVAGCILPDGYSLEGLSDSKKITPKKREALYESIVTQTQYHIVVISSEEIDNFGISYSMKRALLEIQQHLQADEYLFDGNTTFGVEKLKTMIKADGKVPQVSAASILAKVTHDRNIIEDAKRYPEYGFEKHKGYATKEHIEMIKKYGYSPIHRKSYKIKALEPTLFTNF
jgi:ribonuclease HII